MYMYIINCLYIYDLKLLSHLILNIYVYIVTHLTIMLLGAAIVNVLLPSTRELPISYLVTFPRYLWPMWMSQKRAH